VRSAWPEGDAEVDRMPSQTSAGVSAAFAAAPVEAGSADGAGTPETGGIERGDAASGDGERNS
jgi:hypothetical protein